LAARSSKRAKRNALPCLRIGSCVLFCPAAIARSLQERGSWTNHNVILWFTNEDTNYIGRLDSKTGKMALVKVPTPQIVSYGIVILPNNTPIFCEFGTNKFGRVDPSMM
jgi:hypothetical protein